MPKCPHCGNSAEGKFFFRDVWENEIVNRKTQGVLIVCPSCDAVLGGGKAESNF